MAEQILTVVARVKARTDKADKVKEMLMGLVTATRQEPGCIDYILHQSIEDETVFMFYENWTSKEALDAHLQMPHLQDFVAKAEDLLGAPLEINLLNEVR